MSATNPVEAVYGQLTKDGYDLGDIKTFSEKMSDPAKVKTLYDAITKDGYDVGDFNTFSTKMRGTAPSSPNTGNKGQTPAADMTEQSPAVDYSKAPNLTPTQAKATIYGNVPGTAKVADQTINTLGMDLAMNAKYGTKGMANEQGAQINAPQGTIYDKLPAFKIPTIEEKTPVDDGTFFGNLADAAVAGTRGMLSSTARAVSEQGLMVNNWMKGLSDNKAWKDYWDKDSALTQGHIETLKDFDKRTVQPKGGGAGTFIGGMLPFAASVAAAIVTKNPTIATGNTIMFGESGFADGLMAYDEHAAKTGQTVDPAARAGAGIIFGAAMTLPLTKYMGSVGAKVIPKGLIEKTMSKVLTSNPEAVNAMGKAVFENFAAKNPTGAKKLLQYMTKGALHGTATMEAMELSKLAAKDYYIGEDVTMQDYLSTIGHSALSGAAFGVMTAPFAMRAQSQADVARREQTGEVQLAMTEKGDAVEIIPGKDGKPMGLTADGRLIEVSDAIVRNSVTLTTPHFNELMQEYKTNKGQLNETDPAQFDYEAFDRRVAQGLSKVATPEGIIHTATDPETGERLYVLGKDKEGNTIGVDGMGEVKPVKEGSTFESAPVAEVHQAIMAQYKKAQEGSAPEWESAQPSLEAPQQPTETEVVRGKVSEAEQKIAEQLNQEANKDTNALQVVKLSTGEEVSLTGGKLVLNEEGRIDFEKSDQALYYRGEDGSVKMTGLNMVENLVSHQDVGEAKAALMEAAKKNIVDKHNFEGRTVVMLDGNGQPMRDPSGQVYTTKVKAATDQGVEIDTDGGATLHLTYDEAYKTLAHVEDFMEPTFEGATFTQGASRYEVGAKRPDGSYDVVGYHGNDPKGESLVVSTGSLSGLTTPRYVEKSAAPTEQAAQPVAEAVQPTTEAAQPVAPAFPTDKNGAIDYANITEPTVYTDALKQEFKDEAPQVAQELYDEAKAEVAKAGKIANAIDRRRALAKANEKLALMEGVKQLLNPAPVEAPAVEAPTTVEPTAEEPAAEVPINAVAETDAQVKALTASFAIDLPTVVVASNEELIQAIKDAGLRGATLNSFAARVRRPGVRNPGLLYKGVMYINVEGVKDDLAKVILHEATHLAVTKAYSAEQLAELNSKYPIFVKAAIPAPYHKDKAHIKADEAIAFTASKLLDKYTFEQITKGEVDLSTVPSSIRPYITNVLNILTNGRYADSAGEPRGIEANPNGTPASGGEVREIAGTGTDGGSGVREEVRTSDASGGDGASNERDIELKSKVIGEHELRGLIANSPTKDFEAYQKEAVSNFLSLVQPNETITARELAARIAKSYDLHNYKTRVDFSAIWYMGDTKISHTLNSVVERGRFKGNESKAEIEPSTPAIDTTTPKGQIQQILKDYDYNPSSTIAGTIRGIAEVAQQHGIKELVAAHETYLAEVREDRDVWGERGDREAIENAFMNAVDNYLAGDLNTQIADQEPNTNPTEAQKEAGNYKKAHITVQGMDITIENPKGSVRRGVDPDGNAWENTVKSHYGYFKRTEGKDGDHIDVFVGENPESTKVFVVDQVNPLSEFEQIAAKQLQAGTLADWLPTQTLLGNYRGVQELAKKAGVELPIAQKAFEQQMKDKFGSLKNYDEDLNSLIYAPIVDFLSNLKNKAFDESKVMLGYNSAQEAKDAYMANYDKDWKGFSAITEVGVEDFKKWLYDGAKQRKPFVEYKDTPAPSLIQSPLDKIIADHVEHLNWVLSRKLSDAERTAMSETLAFIRGGNSMLRLKGIVEKVGGLEKFNKYLSVLSANGIEVGNLSLIKSDFGVSAWASDTYFRGTKADFDAILAKVEALHDREVAKTSDKLDRTPVKNDRIYNSKKGLWGTVARVFKPVKGSALEKEPFLLDIHYSDGSRAINIPRGDNLSFEGPAEKKAIPSSIVQKPADKTSAMQEANRNKVLSVKVSYDGKVMTRKEFIESVVKEGRTFEVGQVDKIKDLSRVAYNRLDGRAQDAFDKKQREAGKVDEFRAVKPDGSYNIITKTEYDYAQEILVNRKDTPAPAQTYSNGRTPEGRTQARAELLKALGLDPEEPKMMQTGIRFMQHPVVNTAELMRAGLTYSPYVLEEGAVRFEDYAAAMIADLGDSIRPYLKAFYKGTRMMPGEEALAKQMSTDAEVDNYNLDKIQNQQQYEHEITETPTRETSVITSEAEAIANEAGDAKTPEQATRVIERAEELVQEIDAKLSQIQLQLNAYSTDGVMHETPIMALSKPIQKDVANFSKALAKVLGWEHGTDRKGKIDYAKANIAPAGGEVDFTLWIPNTDKGVRVSVQYDPSYSSYYDNYQAKRIAFEFVSKERPYTRIGGFVQVLPSKTTGEVAARIKEEMKYAGIAADLTPSANNSPKDGVSLSNNSFIKEHFIFAKVPDHGTNRNNPSQNSPLENGGMVPRNVSGNGGERTEQTVVSDRANGGSGDVVEGNSPSQRSGQSGSGRDSNGNAEPTAKAEVSRELPTNKRDTNEERVQAVEEPIQNRNLRNHVIERGVELAPRGDVAKITANIAAIKLAKKLNESGELATPEQKAILVKYTGWGGLSAVFKETDPRYKTLKDVLTFDEYESARASTTTSFYTPPSIVSDTWDLISKLGFKGGEVLEPSSGIGHFFGLMPSEIAKQSTLRGVELDAISGLILKALYPDAKINIGGFEEQRIANNSLDLVVTNVPFGNFKVHDKGDKDLSSKFDIHDFFIAKSVRKLKPGGIGVFITTSSTMDKSAALRSWVVNEGNADFIDAFRLNSDTFKQAAGTEATADIIVIRKRDNKGKSEFAKNMQDAVIVREAPYTVEKKTSWGGYAGTEDKTASMRINKYFSDNPNKMAGEMKFGFEGGNEIRPTEQRLAPVKGIDQAEALKRFIDEAPADIFGAEVGRQERTSRESDGTKEGGLTVIDGVPHLIQYGKAVPMEWNANKVAGRTKTQVVEDYISIKNALNTLLEAERTDAPNIEALRTALNKTYDAFVKHYGPLSKNLKLPFLKEDVDYPAISAIEDVVETKGKDGKVAISINKSDIFSKRVLDPQQELKAENVEDGIKVSLYRSGTLDVDFISQLLGKKPEEVKAEIIQSGLGFINPATGLVEDRSSYLSGNVRVKLQQAEQANENGEYNTNVEALSKVLPLDIPMHLIRTSLGSTWIPTEVYNKFFEDQFDVRANIKMTSADKFVAEIRGQGNAKDRQAGVPGATGSEIALKSMNNSSVTIYREERVDGKKVSVKDTEATAAAQLRQAALNEEFDQWTKSASNPYSQQMEQLYNERFNSVVGRTIDVDSFDTFPGASSTKIPRTHQKEGALRAVNGATLLAHEVGTGKTITLISAAMEMRRLGVAKKPCIVVQRSTYEQFVKEIKSLYPQAKVLVPSANDLSAAQREQLFAKIAYNDWDIVVLYHSYLDSIPDDPGRVNQYIDELIQDKLDLIDEIKASGDKNANRMAYNLGKEVENLQGKKVSIKDQEKTKAKAEARAEKLLDRRTDNSMTFEQLGIDALLIDEAHAYKKLGFVTSLQGVKGIDVAASQRAQSLRLKTRYILENNNGKNVVFATGTPISNTMAEMWTFMRYLLPKEELSRLQLSNFDSFVNNFGMIEESSEFSASGKYKPTTRFASFANTPELLQVWKQIAHTVLTEEVATLKEGVGTPLLDGGKPTDIFLKQTAPLKGVMKWINSELEAFDKMSGVEKKEKSHIPLVMYQLAKRAAVDVRLVDSSLPDDPGSKLNKAVEILIKDLDETKGYNGTDAVFCDAYQSKDGKFNVFRDIKDKLIKAGFPADQIAVVNDFTSDEKRKNLWDKMQKGEVRVVLGTTEKLGVGVNIQNKLHLLIHLDAPTRPSDYQQRNGRIIRQGNTHLQMGIPVRIIRLGVEQTLDVTGYQRLEFKKKFIDQVMKGDISSRSLDEEDLESSDSNNFAEMKARLSGSQAAHALSIESQKLKKLENAASYHEKNQVLIASELKKNDNIIATTGDVINGIESRKAALSKVFPDSEVKSVIIGNATANNLEEADKLIAKTINKTVDKEVEALRENNLRTTARLTLDLKINGVKFSVTIDLTKGFDLETRKSRITKDISYTAAEIDDFISTGPADVNDVVNGLKLSGKAGAKVENLVNYVNEFLSKKGFDEAVRKRRIAVEKAIRDNETYRPLLGQSFPKQAELEAVQERMRVLEQQMQEELKEIEAQEASENIEAIDLNQAIEEDSDKVSFMQLENNFAESVVSLQKEITPSNETTQEISDRSKATADQSGDDALRGQSNTYPRTADRLDEARDAFHINQKPTKASQTAYTFDKNLTEQNVMTALYEASGGFMNFLQEFKPLLRLSNVDGATTYLNLSVAKFFNTEFKAKAEDYRQVVLQLQSMSTPSAAEMLEPVLDKIDNSLEYYDRLAEGEDVWRTFDGPRFMQVSDNGFYSTVEKALDAVGQEKGTKDQFKAMLLKNGAKQAELDWMGFDELPDKLTKAEVQKWIDENRIDVQEVIHSDKLNMTDYRQSAISKGKEAGLEVEFGSENEILIDLPGEGTIVDDEVNTPSTRETYAVVYGTSVKTLEVAHELFEENKRHRFGASNQEVIYNTKFSQYVLPGGSNYKELLLTMPQKAYKDITLLDYVKTKGVNSEQEFDNLPFEKQQSLMEEWRNAAKQEKSTRQENFQSSHFDEPNILAHVRFNERNVNGERVLFIEEFQSDWAQKGKKEGFNNDEDSHDVKVAKKAYEEARAREEEILDKLAETILEAQKMGLPVGASSTEWNRFHHGVFKTTEVYRIEHKMADVRNSKEWDEYQSMLDEITLKQQKIGAKRSFLLIELSGRESWTKAMKERLDKAVREQQYNKVPDMPFKKTDQWVNLAARRMMRYAAENGFDRIAWTTGEQQADRYDLAKQVDAVKVWKRSNGLYEASAIKNGSRVMGEENLSESDLEARFGKDLAKKAVNDLQTTDEVKYSGVDLKVGGEGMKAFYDAIVPSAMNKLAKPFGAKVDKVNLGFDSTDKNPLKLKGCRYNPPYGEGVMDIKNLAGHEYIEKGDYIILDEERDPIAFVKAEDAQGESDAVEVWYKVLEEEGEYKRVNAGDNVNSIPVTKAMRESVMEGVPMFMQVVIPTKPSFKDFNGDLAAYSDAMQKYHEEATHVVPALAKEMNEAMGGAKDEFLRRRQDADRHILLLQRWIEAKGGTVTDREDVYSDKNRSIGRATYEAEQFEATEMKGLRDAYKAIIKTKGLDKLPHVEIDENTTENMRKIGLYLQALDIQEAIELGLPNRGELGFYDFTGMSHEDYIDAFQRAVPYKLCEDLQKAMKAATQFGLDKEYKAGLIPMEDHSKYSNRQHYVPQRGWDERDLTDDTHYVKSGGSLYGDPYNPLVVRAKGRETLASDPLHYVQSMGHSAILTSEKNLSKQKALELVRSNFDLGRASGAFSFKQVWYINTFEKDGEDRTIYEETWEKPDDQLFLEDELTKAEIDAKRLELKDAIKNGDQRRADDLRMEIDALREKINIVRHTNNSYRTMRTSGEAPQHEVTVYERGDKYILYFGDERVSNAINNNSDDTVLPWIFQQIGKGTRLYSSLMTQYNPAFAAWNFMRDIQLANLALGAEEGAAFVAAFNKNLFSGNAAIMRHISGKPDYTKWEDRKLDHFFEDGAATGYTYLKDLDQIRKDLRREIEPTLLESTIGNEFNLLNGKALGKVFGALTEQSELMTRFAVYRTALEKGMSREKAASMAKDVTVNFNRKGADIKKMASMFAFLNASIQGSAKVMKLGKNYTGYFASVAIALAVLGFIDTLLTPDDPENERNWSEYDRNQNVLLFGVKLPVTHFFRGFWAAGVQAALAAQGRKSVADAIFTTFQNMGNEVIPASLNPVNAVDWDKDANNIKASTGRDFMPTILSPMYDVWINRTYTGSQVHREALTNTDKVPQSFLAKRDVSPAAQAFSEWMLRFGGGDPNIKDLYDAKGDKVPAFLDVNPSSLEYISTSYTGGVGKFALDLYKTTDGLIKEGKVDATKLPVINRAVKPYNEERVFFGKLSQLKHKVEVFDNSMRERKNSLVVDAKYYSPAVNDLVALATDKKVNAVARAKGTLAKIEGLMDASAKARSVGATEKASELDKTMLKEMKEVDKLLEELNTYKTEKQ